MTAAAQAAPAAPAAINQFELNEANARRYGASAITVVRLSTGRLAVLGVLRRLIGIVETLEEAEELSRNEALRYEMPARGVPQQQVTKTAEELGL